jgi:hypothetical protein
MITLAHWSSSHAGSRRRDARRGGRAVGGGLRCGGNEHRSSDQTSVREIVVPASRAERIAVMILSDNLYSDRHLGHLDLSTQSSSDRQTLPTD